MRRAAQVSLIRLPGLKLQAQRPCLIPGEAGSLGQGPFAGLKGLG
jgi:hypothetical protein